MQHRKYIISEFMNTNVITIPNNATLKQAVEVMIKSKTNGLVVINESNKVAGILSSWDIIQHIVPDYLEEDAHLASFESGDVLIQRTIESANDPIAKFMTANVHVVKPHETLMEAATILSEFKIRQLPVVNDDGVLVGYLNRTDIKEAIGDILGIIEN